MPTAEQKEFEAALGRNRQHTNKQTFTASSDTAMFETIDTPGVDIAGRMGCLITAIAVKANVQSAAATQISVWRSQIAGGTQTAFILPDDPKYIAEYHHYAAATATGMCPPLVFPIAFANPTKPMLVVTPQITIGHVTSEAVDFASDDVYTMFSYQVVPLTIEMHTSLLHAQMDLT